VPAEGGSKVAGAGKEAMADPAINSSLVAQGVQFGGAATPAQFSDFIKAELTKYQKLVKDLNVKAN
jgi:tripartite-type tricarboxylate transporter receptor subunit TctC